MSILAADTATTGRWLPTGKRSTRTVLAAMAAVSLPFLWQGGLPFLPLMLGLAWWRLQVDGRNWTVPSVLMRALLVAPIAAIVLTTSGFGLGRPTGMLLASVWLKLVEMRRDHDYHVQVQFCLLLITAQMLAAIDPFSTAYATASFLFCLVCLQRTADPAAHNLAWMATVRHSLGVLVKALPIALIIFLLVPRGGVQIGLTGEQARTGISDTLQVGSIARLTEDDSRAFTVNFPDGEVPPRNEWYWRGPVLWRVDGNHRWYGNDAPRVGSRWVEETRRSTATTWTQEIVLEPHHQQWLFGLDRPVAIDDNLRFHAGHSIAAKQQVDGRLAYRVVSESGPVPSIFPQSPDYCRDLPPNLDPRVHALARRLTSEHSQETAERIRAWIRDNDFRYTRSPGTMRGDPTATFLFEAKAGFCGHYASAFTILMRAAGHPARIVVGYRGGSWNPYGKFIDVRQRQAHAWSEIFQEGVGWIRHDPTDDALDGDRATDGSDRDRRGGGRGEDEAASGLFAAIGMIYDFIDRAWFRFVYSYDETMQKALLALLGLRGWALILAPIIMVVLAGLLAWLAVRYWPRGREGRDRVSACWHAFCRRSAKRGCRRLHHEGPLTFAARAAAHFPQAADAITAFAQAYAAARYGRPDKAPSPRELKRLNQQIRL